MYDVDVAVVVDALVGGGCAVVVAVDVDVALLFSALDVGAGVEVVVAADALDPVLEARGEMYDRGDVALS
jgi:hypothetical protein